MITYISVAYRIFAGKRGCCDFLPSSFFFPAAKWFLLLRKSKCFLGDFFTALHGMQTQSSDENFVCPSVCLSVCQTRAL